MRALPERCSMTVERLFKSRWCVWVWGCLLVLWVLPVHARTVAVVQPDLSTAEVVETLTRIRGELLAVGLSVQVVKRPGTGRGSDAESTTWLLELQLHHGCDAIIEVVSDAEPLVVEVRVFEDPSKPARTSRVSVAPGTDNAPEKLAIRTSDVLRSAFLESDMRRQRHVVETKDDTPESVGTDPRAVESASRFGLTAGVTTLISLDGLAPAVMPMARVDFLPVPSLAVQAAIAGLGSRAVVRVADGSALVQQSYAVLGARYRLLAFEPFRPFIGLALGVLGTSVEGRAMPPALEHRDNLRSLLVESSLGADWELSERYYCSLAGHVQLANPSTAIFILDSVAATTGRPNLALTLTFGTWL